MVVDVVKKRERFGMPVFSARVVSCKWWLRVSVVLIVVLLVYTKSAQDAAMDCVDIHPFAD